MVIRKRHADRRWGGALVETGVIIGLVAMIVFGVFEYSRLLMDWNLLNNASREGCRYALGEQYEHDDQHRRPDDRDQLHGGGNQEFQQLHRDRVRNAPGCLNPGQQPGTG